MPGPLPAEHEGPISSVCVSPDGLRVLSTTSSGHLGFLDVPSREYSVLMRSHTALVLALATKCRQEHLATVSQDHTVRVWDLVTLQQVGAAGGEPARKERLGDRGHTEALWVEPRHMWGWWGRPGVPSVLPHMFGGQGFRPPEERLAVRLCGQSVVLSLALSRGPHPPAVRLHVTQGGPTCRRLPPHTANLLLRLQWRGRLLLQLGGH